MSIENLEKVFHKLSRPTQVIDMKEDILQYFIVFEFTPTGDPSSLLRGDVTKVIRASMHSIEIVNLDDDEDVDLMTMDVPLPLVWIGSELQ